MTTFARTPSWCILDSLAFCELRGNRLDEPCRSIRRSKSRKRDRRSVSRRHRSPTPPIDHMDRSMSPEPHQVSREDLEGVLEARGSNHSDRKRVVEGKSVSVRYDCGGSQDDEKKKIKKDIK